MTGLGDSGIHRAALDPVETLPEDPARRIPLPPEPDSQVLIWTGLLICASVCVFPIIAALWNGDVLETSEARQLLVSQQTWQRQHAGEGAAWLIPSLNRHPKVDPPPMAVWVHLLSWTGLDPATALPGAMVLRARMATGLFALVALMATYWAGLTVGGVRVARFAALALGTTLLFLEQATMANAEAVLVGWVALAVACGLWAIRPLKPVARMGRRVFGWLFAGLCLGAAVLTRGPSALLFILPPLVAAIGLTPRRRLDNSLGLLFAVMVGLITAVPWYLYLLDRLGSGVWEELSAGLGLPPVLFVLSWSHAKLVLLLMPWLVWLFAALAQPFLRAEAEHRRQLLIAWFWLLLVFVFVSVPTAEDPRHLLPLLPAAALLIGQLWAYHAELAGERQEDPGVNLLRVPHWLILGLCSIFGPLFILAQPQLIRAGTIEAAHFAQIPPWVAIGWGTVLLVLVLLGIRWHFRWRVRAAMYGTVAWMLVAVVPGFWLHGAGPRGRHPHFSEARAVAEAANGAELSLLVNGSTDKALEPGFQFYTQRLIDRVLPDQVLRLAKETRPVCLITGNSASAEELLMAAGFRKIMNFQDGRENRRLYRFEPRPPATRAPLAVPPSSPPPPAVPVPAP